MQEIIGSVVTASGGNHVLLLALSSYIVIGLLAWAVVVLARKDRQK